MTMLTQTPAPERRPADPDGAVAFSPPASSTDPPPRFIGPDADGHVAFSAPTSTARPSARVVYVGMSPKTASLGDYWRLRFGSLPSRAYPRSLAIRSSKSRR